jgi:transaldolase/glucose-6-phosphate isomerase
VVPELADRLGWLTLPEAMAAQAGEFTAFADEIRGEGIRHIVLLGMGGSSLAPEVFQATFGRRDGYPELTVLDSTHPDAVRGVEQSLDLSRTLFVVSSKSGGTSETTSFFRYFWSRYQPDAAGRHFVAITDPGTSLETLARERGFRRVFSAPPDVGGRYSALTAFGLAPAALVGVNVAHLLEHARAMSNASGPGAEGEQNPSVALGVTLGELALAGRDKVTFLTSRSAAPLPAWIEQLVAESTGKHGKGIVPVADEPARDAGDYGTDRVFVTIGVEGEDEALLADRARALIAVGHPVIRTTLGKKIDLGQEFFRWEFATAAAGAMLGIQPFDQPDVQVAKDLARRAMESAGAGPVGPAPGTIHDPAEWRDAVVRWLSSVRPHDYLGVHAYLPPSAGQPNARRDDAGLRSPVPALDRAVAQGRTGLRAVPAAGGRARYRSRGSRNVLHLRPVDSRAGGWRCHGPRTTRTTGAADRPRPRRREGVGSVGGNGVARLRGPRPGYAVAKAMTRRGVGACAARRRGSTRRRRP